MLSRRTGAAAAVLGGLVYVMGGSDGDCALSSGEVASSTSTFKAPDEVTRGSHSAH